MFVMFTPVPNLNRTHVQRLLAFLDLPEAHLGLLIYIFEFCLAQFALFGKDAGLGRFKLEFWAILRWFEPFSSHHK
jgi:hypothetical protein